MVKKDLVIFLDKTIIIGLFNDGSIIFLGSDYINDVLTLYQNISDGISYHSVSKKNIPIYLYILSRYGAMY